MQLQAPDMRAFRAIYFRRNLSTISSLNPNPLFTCKSPNYSQFPCKFHSTLTSSTNETIATTWTTAYPSPPPSDSTSPNTATIPAIYDSATRSVVTKRDPDNKKEPDTFVENSGSSSSIDQGGRIYGNVIGPSSVGRNIRKKGRSRTVYVCEDCGYSDGKWWGTCKQCEKVGSMKRFTEGAQRKVSGFDASENALRSWLPQHVAASAPIKLSDVNSQINELSWRITL